MLPHKLHFYTFSFVMSFLMSAVMSLAMLAIESSSIAEILSGWPRAWGIALSVAFPVSLIIVPLTQRMVSKIVAPQ